MEKPIEEEEEDLVVVTEPVKEEESPSQPERRNTRRRLIQSTLFPHKPQGNENKGQGEEDDANREEENFTSPSSKRKSKAKTKQTTPPKKAKTKQTTPKKAHVKDKESLGRGAENGNSPVTAGKRSNRRLKNKWQGDASPCKDLTPDSSTRPCCRPIMTNCTFGAAEDIDFKSEHAPGPVFNLRLEAKIAAEENARLFAGRQTHPFFSSRKVKKKFQETVGATELENKCCSVLQEDNITSCPPIHVFEMLQDELSLDWRNWIFCDHTFLSSSGVPENASSSVFEDSVQPLSFIDSLMFSNSVVITSLQNDMPLNQSPSQIIDMSTTKPTASSVIANFLVAPHHPKYLQTDNEVNRVVSSLGYTDTISNMSIASEGIFSEERVKSYDNGCGSQPDNTHNSLWTTKYQPTMASEVCGNGESVRFLNDWLRSWHERNLQTYTNSSRGNKCIIQDSDYSLEENDSDTESMDEALKNVLLITGPVGSGKSAAIYACAKEQGFEVIEVSTSDCRNGAHVKQKFGEAMESHRFPKWSVEDPVGSQMKHSLESPSPRIDKSSTQGFDSDVELIQGPCEEEPEVVILGSTEDLGKAKIAFSSRGAKTLILFEDVDTILDEDRGLIATIQQLAETAKRPIILTSNSLNPVLPHQLDRLELSFTLPSSKELLTYLYTVCAAEKVDIPSVLIERLIGCCQGDIRKMILLLQFWCQGKRMNKGSRLQYTYGALQLDLDAGHWVLPKVTPWGFPCQLSEVVEKEITKSLTMANENALLLEVVEEEEFSYEDIQDILEMGFNKETDTIQAKKEAMLSRNGFFNDANEFTTQYDNVGEISNSSGSPVAFARRTAKRRVSTVLSSLSEDELCSENIPGFPHMLSTGPSNETLTGISGENITHTVASLEYLDPSKHMLSTGPSNETLMAISGENIPGFPHMLSTGPSNETLTGISGENITHTVTSLEYLDPSKYMLSTGPSNETLMAISGEHLAHTVASLDDLDPSTAQLYHFERKAEQDQCKFSETESAQQMCDTYKSVDLSCVPESSYVLETEIKDGAEFSSKTVCCADASVTLKEFSSSSVKSIEGMDALNLDKFIPETNKSSKTILGTDYDIDAELVNGDEEVGDSHNEHEVTASRGYQAMDECSRADFPMASISVEGRCPVRADSVQETWKKLRNCRAELNSYITSKQKEAYRIARLVSGVTDLISEADLMHGCCQPLFRDSLEVSMLPSVEPDVIFSYDKHLEMTSTTVQHGLCLFGKESAATESNLHFKNRVDFAWEMLAFTTDTTELGKFVTRDMSASQSSSAEKALERPRNVLSLKREVEERIYNTIQELVPSRLYLALKGSAFHEYMSSLGQISKSEASRLSENIDKPRQRRRARVARHYLSTGQMILSPEESSLLAQHCCYGSKASQVLTKESTDYT